MQTLFICSGCDFVSFFAGFGKAIIIRECLVNYWYTGHPGTVAETGPGRVEEGFMSFVRLVGTINILRNSLNVNTPLAL